LQFITAEAKIDNTIEKFNKNLSKCMNAFETRVDFFCDKYEENYRKNVILALKAEVQNINNQTRNRNSVNSIIIRGKIGEMFFSFIKIISFQ
jgi:hypothetical protein